MKLYRKMTALLAAAVLAAVLMPVCMAAPGDSITTRVVNAMNQRTSADLYEEIATTTPDGTTQNMTVARSGGNAYIKMTIPEAGDLVYVLRDGQGYLLDSEAKLAVKGVPPTVTVDESAADSAETEQIPGVETRVNVNGQDYDALSYTSTTEDGQTVTVFYCVDGDTLKYTVTDEPEGRTIVEFKVIDPNVDQNLFVIPADYQIITEEEASAMSEAK